MAVSFKKVDWITVVVAAQAAAAAGGAYYFAGATPAMGLGLAGVAATAAVFFRDRFGFSKTVTLPAQAEVVLPPSLLVHAVRRTGQLVGGYADDAERHWYAIEGTIDFPALRQDGFNLLELCLVAEDAPPASGPDDPAWGYVAAARIWQGDTWAEANTTLLREEARVRLLAGIWPDAPGRLKLRRGQRDFGLVDLARADLPPSQASETTAAEEEHPGECVSCGNMDTLNPDDLCPRCRQFKACLNHPEERTASRCVRCREPYCQKCLREGRCSDCFALRRATTGPIKGGASAARKKTVKAPVDRRLVLAGSVGVLILVQAVTFGIYYLDAPPPLTEDAALAYRVASTVQAVRLILDETGRLPTDVEAIKNAITKDGGKAPNIVFGKAKAAPGTIVFDVTEDGYAVWAVNSAGEEQERREKKVGKKKN